MLGLFAALGVAASLFLPTTSSAIDFVVLAENVPAPCGTTGVDTGIDVTSGDRLIASVSPSDLWSARPDVTHNAGGSPAIGEWTHRGLTTLVGTLAGSIGESGDLFRIGLSYDQITEDAGRLFLYSFDCVGGDNSGSVLASVSVVPAAPAVPAMSGAHIVAFAAATACIGVSQLRRRVPPSSRASNRDGRARLSADGRSRERDSLWRTSCA